MKIIEKNFTYRNFEYTQLFREGKLAIYEQKLKDDGVGRWYETVIIESHNGYELAGQKFPPSEMYPSSTQWGVKGFTFQTYDDAMEKLKKLKKNGK